MNKPVNPNTLIPSPEATVNPLDQALWLLADKLRAYSMTRLWSAACPEIDEAEALNADILVIGRYIDEWFLALGKIAKDHFGGIEIELFREQFRSAVEGNATYSIQAAAEAEQEWRRDLNDEYRSDRYFDYASDAA